MNSQYQVIQANVLRILEPAKLGDRTSKIWDLSLFGLVVLNLIAVALESVPNLQKNYGMSNKSFGRQKKNWTSKKMF